MFFDIRSRIATRWRFLHGALINTLQLLKHCTQVVIVDDSFSMTSRLFGQCSRWDLACDTLQILAELAADHDDDGVDVFFLNSKHALKACLSPSFHAIIAACAGMTVFLHQISRGHNVRAIMQVAAPV